MNIELFPCSGGMAEGFRRAGIEFDIVFDYDADACESYRQNLGHQPIQMDVRDLLRMVQSGWPPLHVDLLLADPPCTPWSRAGKRQGLDDERDMLATTCEIIRLLEPTVWVIGNVPGLDDSTNSGAVDCTIGRLEPRWHVDYARLDAADFGVPQRRVRPFWVGHPPQVSCVRWPDPTHGPPKKARQLLLFEAPLLPWVTCRQALEGLTTEEMGRPVRVTKKVDAQSDHNHRLDAPAKTITTAKRGTDRMETEIVAHDHHRASDLDEPSHTIKSNGGRASGNGAVVLLENAPSDLRPKKKRGSTKGSQSARIGDADKPAATVDARPGRKGTGESKVLAWPWDRPATTVLSDPRLAPPGHHSGSFLSPKHPTSQIDAPGKTVPASMPGNGGAVLNVDPNAIVLSEKAALRLQGLPDTWVVHGETKKSRWAQIGMAMPPKLAEVVARAVAVVLAQAKEL